MKTTLLTLTVFASLTLGTNVNAQITGCEAPAKVDPEIETCGNVDSDAAPLPQPSPIHPRVLKYARVANKHNPPGLPTYSSRSPAGPPPPTGEFFHTRRFTAAHLTLPLGSWVEVTSRATGRKIRVL